MQHGSVGKACMVRGVGHVLCQVAGAVQRVCVGPLLKRLLSVEKHQLKGHCRFLAGDQMKMCVRKSRA